MKKQSLLITLLAIALSTTILYAEDKPAQELSNTRYAVVALRITTDPKTFPMGNKEHEINRLSQLMFRQEVLKAAWSEVIGTSNEVINAPIIEMPREIGGLQTASIKIEVKLSEEQKPAAKEFLEAYIEKLRAALQKQHDAARDLFGKKFEVYFQRRDQAERELHNLLGTQSKLAGGLGPLDKESVRRRILEHERAKMENGMQQSLLKKRAKELIKHINGFQNKGNEIAAISAKIQALRQERDRFRTEYEKIDFERNQLAKGADSRGKVSEMTDLLSDLENKFNNANTEIDKLDKSKQQLESQIADEIRELKRELRESTMRQEELEIEHTVLAGYSPGRLSDSIDYEMLEVSIEAAKENLLRAILEMDEAGFEVDLLQPPMVTYDEIVCSETVPEKE